MDTAQVNGCSVDLCVFLFSSRLVRHSWHLTNDTVTILLVNVVSPCWLKHRDRSSAPGTIRLSIVPSCPVPEVPIVLRRRFVLQSETRSCIGVETTSERVSGQCVGWARGLSLGTKVVQTCGSVIAMSLSRQLETTFDLREVEEQLPWHDLFDSLRETDEQTYFDLSPPGVSRDPQYGGPSTSNDVPMTPVPVPDESMPDAIADEPDTSEIPVLPNSVYAPVRNHECVGVQMLWNILRHSLFYHLLCLRKMCLQPHHHGLHLFESPVRHRWFQNLSHLTLICNPSFHRQRPQQMMIPCHFLTLKIHHHGSVRNQKRRGFLPSKIHQ